MNWKDEILAYKAWKTPFEQPMEDFMWLSNTGILEEYLKGVHADIPELSRQALALNGIPPNLYSHQCTTRFKHAVAMEVNRRTQPTSLRELCAPNHIGAMPRHNIVKQTGKLVRKVTGAALPSLAWNRMSVNFRSPTNPYVQKVTGMSLYKWRKMQWSMDKSDEIIGGFHVGRLLLIGMDILEDHPELQKNTRSWNSLHSEVTEYEKRKQDGT